MQTSFVVTLTSGTNTGNIYNTPPTSTSWALILTPASSAVTAASNTITLQFTASTTDTTTNRYMALTAVTLVGPVQSTASATASSLVFINSGMIPFGYVNWDGISTVGDGTAHPDGAGFTGYSSGDGQTYFTLYMAASSGSVPLNALVYAGHINFPSTNPAGLSYSNFWRIYTYQSEGLTRTFRNDLVVGGVYSASFWHVQRANGNPAIPAPTVFVVTIGGNTVWNTPPTSTSWYYVTTQFTTVTSASASLVFTASCSGTSAEYDMALSAVTLNGQLSLPVLSNVLSAGLLSHEYSTFDGYFTFGGQPGPGNSLGGISTLSAGTVLGPWTTTGSVLVYNTGAGSSPYGGVSNPYGGAYALWLQTSSGSNSGITRTFKQRVVGGSYMASFWYMKRDSTLVPTSFVVTLGGTVVWNQVPSTDGNTWVQVASSAVVATTSSMTLSLVASATDNNDRNMALGAVTLIGPARYLHFDGIVTPGSTNYVSAISMGNTVGDWFVTTLAGTQVPSSTTGFFIFQPGSTPSSVSGFSLTSNPGTMGLTYAGLIQTSSTVSSVSITRSFANAVVGGQYSLSFWFAMRSCSYACLTPNSFTVTLANTVVWSTLPTSASWQYSVTRNATASQSFFSVAFNAQSSDSLDRNMAINAITIYQWPAASASRPAISNDGSKLFVGGGGQGLNDSNVYAVTSSSGTNLWQYNTGGAVKSTPALSTDGATVYVGSDDTKMYALSASTLDLQWSLKTNGEVQSSPANTSTGLVMVPSLDGATYAIATPVNVNFSYTGSVQSFTVPFGVTSMQVTMAGATGGSAGNAAGGAGGLVSTTIAVTARNTYLIYVGGMGASSPGAGGFNGGGFGGVTDGGGGGGASDIRTSTSIGTRIVVAGGGGGASSPPSTTCSGGVAAKGGNGGGASNNPTGADAPSLPCSASWTPYTTAKGGSLTTGGIRGVDPWGINRLTQSGALGIGGSQMNLQSNVSSGGGGGGGYFGGGAGGFGPGAGGSSYCSAFVCSSTYFTVTNGGGSVAHGYVTLTYALPNSAPDIISSFAGQGGIPGSTGDGSAPLLAGLNGNFGLTIDVFGNLYIADQNNQRIRKAVANVDGTMTMTTFAGTGTAGFSNDGGAATSAYLYNPSDIAVDATGSTVYITDFNNNRIRKVVVATGIITTYAGTGTASYSGDGVLAISTSLNNADGLVLDNSGNLYIADQNNHIIRFVKYSTGIITTYAGIPNTYGVSGDYGAATSAKLNQPRGVALDSSNNLYIADTSNHRIRIVNAVTNIITTVAGGAVSSGYGGDYQFGATTSAAFGYPYRITHDPWLDCFYIADRNNNRIRVLTSNGMLYTVAGTGASGFYGDNYDPLSAKLASPQGVTVDASGNLYISDYNNAVIRQIAYNPNPIAGLIGCASGQYRCLTAVSGCCICPTGSYCPGADVAYTCPANTYNAMTGGTSSSACIACPSYMAAVAGSSVCTYAVNTIAGTGVAGSSGDGGPASLALLYAPKAAVMDKSGNLYVSDTSNGEIRKITNFAQHWGNQNITRIAGNTAGLSATDGTAGTSTILSSGGPWDIDVDLSGNVYFSNTNYHNIKMISVVDGTINNVAGQLSGTAGFSGDGTAATIATLNSPAGLFLNANMYIADKGNHRIRFVNLVTKIISTVAGNGVAGSAGEGVSAISANLNLPTGICLDSSGILYIADTNNNRIRMVINGYISTLAGNE